MYLLDTCICVEFLRGRLRTGYRVMRECGNEQFALPAIVVAELFYGAEHSVYPPKELRLVEQFVNAFTIEAFDDSCGREYGRIKQNLGLLGKLIGDRDMMIAATALVHDATLITRNVKEFMRVGGLRIESWDEEEI